MKRIIIIAVCLLMACSYRLPPRECGEYGYSHFVNFPEVQRAIEMCDYTYKSDEEIKEKYDHGTRVFIEYLKDIDVRYFIVYDDMLKRQYVVIRGTATLDNAKTDGKYRKTLNKRLTGFMPRLAQDSLVKNERLKIYAHRGFNKAGQTIYRDITGNDRLAKGYETAVYGHSLGGAAALIVYLNLYVDDDVKLGMLYTFGQPKVLAHDGVLKYRCVPCIRFVNEDDIVPLVPPTKFGLGLITSLPLWRHGPYRHLGDEVILLKDSNYVYLEYHDAERINTASFWRKLGRREVSVHDHHTPQYLANLEIKKDVITEREYRERRHYKTKR